MTLHQGIPELREFAETFMVEPTEIQRLVETEDEPGYPRTSWETVHTTKSFALPVGQRELLRAQQADYEVEARRLLPVGTDVRVEDRLWVEGEGWEVTGIPEYTEELSAHVEVYLKGR